MINRIQRTPIMHRLVEYQGVIYCGGVIADDTEKSMAGQTREILAKLDALLAAAGTSKANLLSAQIYITNMRKKGEMNEAWVAWLDENDLPARATIGVADLGPGILVEIVVTAAVSMPA